VSTDPVSGQTEALKQAAEADNPQAMPEYAATLAAQDTGQPPYPAAARRAARRRGSVLYILYLVLIAVLCIGGLFVPALGSAFDALCWIGFAVGLIATAVGLVRRGRARIRPLSRPGASAPTLRPTRRQPPDL
jgi:hypothetical protein